MPQFNITSIGFQEFRDAIKRNPQVVDREVKAFEVRAIAEYNRGILRNPWRVGGSGGGSPHKTGHLRDTHRRVIIGWEASIFPTASYAMPVHEGTNKMRARPWMDYVFKDKASIVKKLQMGLLENIVKALAK